MPRAIVEHRRRGQGHLAHMDLEDLLAAETSGLGTTTWRSKRRDATAPGPARRAVGGGDQDDAFVRLKAVHLDEQLVQRLLALVIDRRRGPRRDGDRRRRSHR